MDGNQEDSAIATAAKLPKGWHAFDKLAATKKLSDAGLKKIINMLSRRKDPSQIKSFAFEASHHLPQDAQPNTLNNLAYFGKDSDYVFANVSKHPNWSYTKPFQDLKAASEHIHTMLKERNPILWATWKSLATNKAEEFTGPNGEKGNSDPVIGKLFTEYAKALQGEIKEHSGDNIVLYKALHGSYVQQLKDALESDESEVVHAPVFQVMSWTSEPQRAKELAGDKGVVIQMTLPVDRIVYSNAYRVVHGQGLITPQESNFMVLHPEGQLTLTSENLLAPETLGKSIKGVAGALAAATMLGLPAVEADTGAPKAPVMEAQKHVAPHPDLHIIKQIESSGGANTDHPEVTTGMNKGTSAIGDYGLMPITVVDIVKKHPALSHKYPDIANSDPVTNQEYIRNFLTKHPDAQDEIANTHWRNLGHRFDYDENKMAHAWYNGMGNTLKASSEEIAKHPYVKKYNMYKKLYDLEKHPGDQRIHRNVQKAEKDHGVTAFTSSNPADGNIGKYLNELIAHDDIHDLSNTGHFTHSSFVAGHDENSWLIKVEPTNSPAVRSAKAGLQTVKEAAFHDAASKAFGLQEFLPRVVLGEVKKHGEPWPCAAIKMFDPSYVAMSQMYKTNKQEVMSVLHPLLRNGMLHKLGAMYYILGEADGHGQNVLTNGKDMKLIDHGTSLADASFNPPQDDNIYIPYFLRAGRVRDRMPAEEKYLNMPKVNDIKVETDLKHWILNIPGDVIHTVLEAYGIDSTPILQRLDKMKEMMAQTTHPDDVVNKLWTIGE